MMNRWQLCASFARWQRLPSSSRHLAISPMGNFASPNYDTVSPQLQKALISNAVSRRLPIQSSHQSEVLQRCMGHAAADGDLQELRGLLWRLSKKTLSPRSWPKVEPIVLSLFSVLLDECHCFSTQDVVYIIQLLADIRRKQPSLPPTVSSKLGTLAKTLANHCAAEQFVQTLDSSTAASLLLAFMVLDMEDDVASQIIYRSFGARILDGFSDLPLDNGREACTVLLQVSRVAHQRYRLLHALSQLMACRTVRNLFGTTEVTEMAISIGRDTWMTPQEVTMLAWTFTKLGLCKKPLSTAILKHLLEKDFLTQFNAQQITSIALSIPPLQLTNDTLMELLGQRILHMDILQQLNTSQMADIAHAFASAKAYNGPVLFALASRQLTLPPDACGAVDDVVRLAYAIATLRIQNTSLIEYAAGRMVSVGLHTLNSSQLANMLWAMGQAKAHHPQFLDGIAKALMEGDHLQSLTPAEAGRVAWGFAALNVSPNPLLTSLADLLAMPASIAQLPPFNVVSIAWAYAELQVPCNSLLTALGNHLVANDVLRHLSPEETVTLAWALARLNVHHPSLLSAISDTLGQPGALSSLDTQVVLRLAWSIATLHLSDTKLLTAMAEHIMRNAILQGLTSGDILMASWAFASVGFKDGVLMQYFADQIVKHHFLASYSATEVSTLAWAFATLEVHNGALMAVIAEWLMQCSTATVLTPTHMANFLWSFAQLGIHREPMLKHMAEVLCSTDTLAQCSPSEVASFAWAFATFHVDHPNLTSMLANQVMRDGYFAALSDVERVKLAWALAVLGSQHETPLAHALQAVAAVSTENLTPALVYNLHQFLLHIQLHSAGLPSCHALLAQMADFVAQSRKGFTALQAESRRPSQVHSRVVRSLWKIGLTGYTEFATPDDAGGYQVDVLLGGRKIVIEIGDRTSYLESTTDDNWKQTATVHLKEQQLQLLGYQVIHIPFYEWQEIRSAEKERMYLRQVICLDSENEIQTSVP